MCVGDLCNMVQLGDEYTVIGIPVYEVVTVDGKTTINTILEVHIHTVEPDSV